MITFSQFVEWSFLGGLSGLFAYAVYILGQMSTSVHELNIKLAVILEKVDGHEKRLDRLENNKE
jgi:hypothetical protein